MSDESYHFSRLGMQYYISARMAARAALVPVTGNLFHHAVEMLFKAHFVKSITLKQIYKAYGHNLGKLWTNFKFQFPSEPLGQFDLTISELDRFERLRYPDKVIKEGAGMLIDWAPGPHPNIRSAGAYPTPNYALVVGNIDLLVEEIFRLSSLNPQAYAAMLNAESKLALAYQNANAAPFWKINTPTV